MRYLLTTLLFLYSSSIFALNYTTDTIVINSKILNESRIILIFKPDGLIGTDSVSFIYMLDGEFAKYRFDKIAENQHLIGIAIINTNRNRDMLPVKEPGKFLEFVEKELMAQVEVKYLINQRILYGHSFAGGFTIYSLINRPGLFNKYIASSPTPIMKMVDPSIYQQLDKDLNKNVKLYFSYGSDDMKQVKTWGERLKTNLSTLTFKHIVWQNEVYEGEDHNTSDKISIVKGIVY